MNAFVSINRGFGGAEKQFDRLYADMREASALDSTWHYERHDLSQQSMLKTVGALLKLRGRTVVYNMSVLGIGVFPLLLLRLLGNRIFLYPHVVVSPTKSRPRLWLLRLLLQRLCTRLATRVIAISEGNLFTLDRFVPREKMTVIYNYVDCENSRPFVLPELNNEIAIIGRLQDRHKGQLTFVRRHGEFIRDLGLIVHFFGSGPDEAAIRAHVEMEGLQQNFILHGWLSEQEIFSRPFSFVLNLSRWEGMPLSILESIYHDRIVLLSNIDGNRELAYGDFLFKDDSELRAVIERFVMRKHVNQALMQAQKAHVFERCNKRRALALLRETIATL